MLDAESRDPTYRAQTQPATTDHNGRIIPRGFLRALQLKLDSANAGQEFKLSGDFLFLDRNTTGIVTTRLNDPTEYGLPMAAFDMIEGVPIDRVFLSWAAQPGLVANIWYGYQARLRAASQSISTIGSITAPIAIAGDELFDDRSVQAGEAFAKQFTSPAVAAAFSHAQLINPAGSGVILYVDRAGCAVGGGPNWIAATLYDVALNAVGTGLNKNSGGAVSKGLLKNGSNAAVLGSVVVEKRIPADNEFDHFFRPALRLTEGHGVALCSEVVNTLSSNVFEWRERTV